jgi:hypothetical protein
MNPARRHPPLPWPPLAAQLAAVTLCGLFSAIWP